MIGEVKIPGTPCGARLKNPREDGRTTCVKLVIPSGRCRSHGGAAPQAERGRLMRLTQAQATARAQEALPSSAPITPEEALQQELQRTQAALVGLELAIAGGEDLPGLPLGAMLVSLTAERGQLHRVAADMIRLDVAGRRESVLHRDAAEAVAFVRAFCVALGLKPHDPMVQEAFRTAADKTARGVYNAQDNERARRELGT